MLVKIVIRFGKWSCTSCPSTLNMRVYEPPSQLWVPRGSWVLCRIQLYGLSKPSPSKQIPILSISHYFNCCSCFIRKKVYGNLLRGDQSLQAATEVPCSCPQRSFGSGDPPHYRVTGACLDSPTSHVLSRVLQAPAVSRWQGSPLREPTSDCTLITSPPFPFSQSREHLLGLQRKALVFQDRVESLS